MSYPGPALTSGLSSRPTRAPAQRSSGILSVGPWQTVKPDARVLEAALRDTGYFEARNRVVTRRKAPLMTSPPTRHTLLSAHDMSKWAGEGGPKLRNWRCSGSSRPTVLHRWLPPGATVK